MKTTFKALVLAASLSMIAGSAFAGGYDVSTISDLTVSPLLTYKAALLLDGSATDAVAVIRQQNVAGTSTSLATIDQTGGFGLAVIDQMGDNGIATITQLGGTVAADVLSFAYIMQDGTGTANNASITQTSSTGITQSAVIAQAGGGNSAVIIQH